jgi:hypothetical protein
MMRNVLIILAATILVVPLASADWMVLNTGKKLRIQSYRVEGTKIEVQINERSEMIIPLEWVQEIRDEPDLPPVPKIVNPMPVQPQISTKFAFADHIQSASEKYNLDWRLIAAVMKVESNFNPRAISRKGAQGLMQLMPDTSKLYRVKKPYDPEENIDAGVKHLKKLMQRYDNRLELVLAAYNAGEKAVDRFRGIPPYNETQLYVKKVMNLYRNGL